MAKLSLLLQAIKKSTHADALRTILALPNADLIIVSVGFARESGIESVADALAQIASKTRFFVGIRNDISTVQGVKRLLQLKPEKLFLVDTGSRDTIFHPKLYLVRSATCARGIIGSANLTFQGLHNNIEGSAIVELDLTNAHDETFVEDTVRTFDDMVSEFPQHVIEITQEDEINELFAEGRLSDELIIPAQSAPNQLRGKGQRDSLGRMKLHRVVQPRLKRALKKIGTPTKKVRGPAAAVATSGPSPGGRIPDDELYLVWESKPLSERDLNIPKGTNTHATGSMSLDKGTLEDVDHRHFFRDEVFRGLRWASTPGRPHLETARADFELVIKGVNYGIHTLTLSHNNSTTSASYRQHNAMTGLRWGDAKPFVAKSDLKGRTLFLYRKDTKPPQYRIEID